ncbi:MAG TPA: hypothetical protein VHC70_13605, partial [Phycisphaerales bacterium]|nr:hypothetical protein [Phycisphaerales bacterium]
MFDFEEPGNPYPVPAHWSHAQDDPNGPPSARRPGFPQWNRAEFYYKDAVSGKACVEVPTHGGSACLRLDPGEVPIFPDADYTVSAKVKTLDLEHGRAFLTARLLDQRLRPIAGSEARSEPILSPTGWTTATVVVAGRFPEAAWLQIDLELLQPEMFTPPPTETMAEHTVVHADVSGAALFDDVSIALLPRTRFWSTEPTGLFVAPQKATLGMLARDQGGEQLHARVVITDVDGRRVAQQSFALDPSAHPTMWSPNLPGLGWYRAVMDIDAGGPGDGGAINVSRSEVWFATLPEPLKLSQSAVRNADFARFGIAADRLPEPLLERLVPLVGRTHTRFLSLPAFDARTPVEQEKADLARRSPTIERLIVQGQEITLVVGDVPPSVAAKETLDPTDALGMAALDPAIWGAFVEPTLDALGQRILRYQLGHTDDTHALRRPAGAGLEGFEVFSARLVPGPKIALPWRADYTFPSFQRSAGAKVDSGRPNSASNVAPGPLVDAMPTIYPLGFPVEAMADLARAWRERCRAGEAFELTVVPELPDMARFGPRARAVVAARKIAEFWRTMSADGDPRIGAGANAPSTPPPRIALNAPWKIAPAGSGSAAEEFAILPAPELGVTALMAERLAGRRVVGSIPAAPGVHAFLIAERAGASSLAGLGTGLGGEALVRAGVVAWNDSASPDHAFVEVYPLRESVTVVDMFGNATTMDAKPPRGAPA